jgi:hypothetical protein
MSEYGSINLKKRYLGGEYVGQELCYCKIEIGINAVAVSVMKNGRSEMKRFFEDPDKVSTLKTKLREYLLKMQGRQRWSWSKVGQGTVYMMIYYPSVTWGGNTGKVRLFCSDGAF